MCFTDDRSPGLGDMAVVTQNIIAKAANGSDNPPAWLVKSLTVLVYTILRVY